MSNIELTEEQKIILLAEPTKAAPLKVTAFTGTGKTFTLERYAKLRPRAKMLYVAYNKSIQQEAERKMPTNVQSRTVHSIAFGKVGRLYKEKLGNLKVGDLMRFFKLDNYQIAYCINEVLKVFMASADYSLSREHITKSVRALIGTQQDDRLLDHVSTAWDKIISTTDFDLCMPHDGYLKLFHLQEHRVNSDFILVDEAQDITPVMRDIFWKQQARKVVVGDPHQAIYQWRGSINALDHVITESGLDLTLSQSFRFGPAIAEVATNLLKATKGETRSIKGNPELDTKLLLNDDLKNDSRTLLCRGNSQVFEVASERASSGKRIAFIGGAEGYRLQLLLDVLALRREEHGIIKNPFVRSFKEFEDLKNFANETEDNEIIFACEKVEIYGIEIKDRVRDIRNAETSVKNAQLIFSTVHKAKGLEWDYVHLAEDLEKGIQAHLADPRKYSRPHEEVNVIYVALTRGIQRVSCTSFLKKFARFGWKVNEV